jgi:putative restriction endonuclease
MLKQFDRLCVWSQGDQRAPHNPLLVLYALGRWQRDDTEDISHTEVDWDLGVLLRVFGSPSEPAHLEYPFWLCDFIRPNNGLVPTFAKMR